MKRATLLAVVFALSLSLILGACSSAATSTPTTTTPSTENTTPSPPAGEPVTLKIAVLPIVDTLPMYVADAEGLFEARGLKVEFIPVASAPERDQILLAGQADGTITDGIAMLFLNQEGIRFQMVRYAQKPSPDYGSFSIVTAKDSGITHVANLKQVEIGISEGTIIEYVLDRLLEKEGFTDDEIHTIAIPKIPDRMALLSSVKLKAAVLPDPLAPLAASQGAKILLDNSNAPYGASVYAFSTATIAAHPSAVANFVAAIDEAVALIAQNPDKYKPLLAEKHLVPDPLLEGYRIPPFPTEGVLTQAEWNDIVAWAEGKGLVKHAVPYESVVIAFK